MTTKLVLKALKAASLTARASWPKCSAPASEYPNVVVLNGRVINIMTCSILGFGCFDNPVYQSTMNSLCDKVESALRAAGIKFTRSLPDQYLLA